MRKNEHTYIFGEKVVLVPYKEQHVSRYHQWMQSEELRNLTASEQLTLEEEYDMQKKWLYDDDKCTFIILDALNYQQTKNEIASMVGDTNFFFIDELDHSKAEVEIMIAEPIHRRRGLGKEALQLMLRYGVEELHVKLFEVKITDTNSVSRKLFENLGFVQCGENKIFHEVILELFVTDDWSQKLHEATCNSTMNSKKI